MQATVHTFDAGTRCGSVLTDDGRELPFDQDAFDRGAIRLLRPGQRVRLRLEPPHPGAAAVPGQAEAARVHALTIVTLAASPDIP
jgi:cold shock CspA family protein